MKSKTEPKVTPSHSNQVTTMPPNPALDPIKAFVRQHGGSWPAWAFKLPRACRRAPVCFAARPTPDRVFVITPNELAPGRRFAVVARDWNAAFERLGVLLS